MDSHASKARRTEGNVNLWLALSPLLLFIVVIIGLL